MSVVSLTCDICDRDFSGHFDKIAALNPNLKIPGRVEHVCQDCVKIVDIKLNEVRQAFEKEVSESMRNWLEVACHNPKLHKKQRILTN